MRQDPGSQPNMRTNDQFLEPADVNGFSPTQTMPESHNEQAVNMRDILVRENTNFNSKTQNQRKKEKKKQKMHQLSGKAAGVAEFAESGSNYGKNRIDLFINKRPEAFAEDPSRGAHDGRRDGQQDDSTDAVPSNEQEIEHGSYQQPGRDERGEAIYNDDDYADEDGEDDGSDEYQDNAENGPGPVEGSSDQYYAPNESSVGDTGNNPNCDDTTVLVRQCKLKRSRFTFLGQSLHGMENYGGKAEPLRSFRS